MWNLSSHRVTKIAKNVSTYKYVVERSWDFAWRQIRGSWRVESHRKTLLPSHRFRVGAYRGTITRLFEEGVQDFLRRYSGREFSIPRRSTVRTLNFYCDPFSLALVDRIDIGITLTREINNGTPLIGNSRETRLFRRLITIFLRLDFRIKQKRNEKVAADVNSSQSNDFRKIACLFFYSIFLFYILEVIKKLANSILRYLNHKKRVHM